jgi:hypothetical protein
MINVEALKDYLQQAKFNYYSHKLDSDTDFSYYDIKPTLHLQYYDNELPADLTEFYQLINYDTLYFSFKLFHFKSYKNLVNEYYEQIYTKQSTKLHIGDIYQGMGYYVSLFYDFAAKCYYFMEQGGSEYISRNNNIVNLQNLTSNKIPNKCKFNTIEECLRLINNINCQYYDEPKFLNSEFVIR